MGSKRAAWMYGVFALLASTLAPASEVRGAPPRIVVLTLSGSVQPGSLRYLQRAIQHATAARAALVLLELDTPGGLLVSLREMTKVITQSGPPVVTYVTPPGARAASAGFFLLLASDVAAMAPGTNTGAAHPVGLGGAPSQAPPTLDKITNDTAALARSLAMQRGRSVVWAELAVRQSRSFTEREALAGHLIDVVASNQPALIRGLDGRTVRRFDGRMQTLDLTGAVVERVAPGLGERLLMLVADPEVAYILLLVGLFALGVELIHPGATVPGVVGAVSLLLAFYAFSVLPVSFVGALLLLTGIGLFVAEVFIVSHGLLGAGGLVCFVLGSVMLVQTPIPGAGIGLWLVLPTALVLGGLLSLLLTRAVQARRAPHLTGLEALVGELGEVVVPLAPQGKVFVHGEYWDAVGQTDAVRGARVRVTAVEGRTLRVALVPLT